MARAAGARQSKQQDMDIVVSGEEWFPPPTPNRGGPASSRSSTSETDQHQPRVPTRIELGEDIRELFDRVEDLDGLARGAQRRIGALEEHAGSAGEVNSDELTVAELGTIVARRFNELTSDRDLLNLNEIKYQAEKQAKANVVMGKESSVQFRFGVFFSERRT
ncbi:hypothetical protein B0H10DRAFT_1940688 [Mycena sp. CBHHK59/15]|nr:hypothetical protein B0H10DRAFT_1940688 [Mycena sp. CBHHK59/15]